MIKLNVLRLAAFVAATAMFTGSTASHAAGSSWAMTHGNSYSTAPAPVMPSDSVFTSHLSGGETVSTRCKHSYYSGTTCDTTSSGGVFDYGKPVEGSPVVDMSQHSDEHWADKCNTSCAK
jgi:hypothetical protein